MRLFKPLLILLPFSLLLVYAQPLLMWMQVKRLGQLSCDISRVDTDTCLRKVWAHRVNSIQRARIMHNQFAGFETDIVWDAASTSFLVYHPPLKGIPITLDSFLNVPGIRPLIWFDTRSTNLTDTSLILAALQKVEQYYNLKQKGIFELYEMSVANFLAGRGYKVALNINPEWIEGYSRGKWDSLKTGMSHEIAFVAQEEQYVDELEELFPDMQIITWSTSINNYFNLSNLNALVNNKRISVVLVNVKSRYYQ